VVVITFEIALFPIILLAAIIWFLKIYQNGKYCTFPQAIEFLNKKYAETFVILTS